MSGVDVKSGHVIAPMLNNLPRIFTQSTVGLQEFLSGGHWACNGQVIGAGAAKADSAFHSLEVKFFLVQRTIEAGLQPVFRGFLDVPPVALPCCYHVT